MDDSARPLVPAPAEERARGPRVAEESTWIARAQRGDASAFAQLYEHSAPAVNALLHAYLPADRVEDAHQEVYLAAWQALPRFRIGSPWHPWLYGIARNLARRAHREQARLTRTRSTEETTPEVCADPAQPLLDEEHRMRVQRLLGLLQRLPDRERELLALRLIEGLTPSDIATHLDSTPGSVRVRLHRALTRLRAMAQEAQA